MVGERLNRNRQDAGLVGRGDLGGGGEAWTKRIVGNIEGNDNLEVFRLFSACGRLRGGNAGGAQDGLIAHQGYVALEGASGQGVDGDVGGLADLDIDDVGLVDLDLSGDDAHVGQGHQRGAFGVLNADHYGFALADGEVGHDAVKGCDGNRLVQGIHIRAQGGLVVGDLGFGGLGLSAGLHHGGVRLVESGDGQVVGSFLGVEVLLGNELLLVEALAASPVQLLLFEISLGVFDVGFGGSLGGDERGNIGLGGGNHGLLRGHVSGRLHVLDAGQNLTFLNVIAFLHIEMDNAAKGGCTHVDVGLRLDLPGAADHGGEVLPDHFAGEHCGVSGLRPDNHEGHKASHYDKRKDDEKDFFHNLSAVRKSPLTVYAMISRWVPIKCGEQGPGSGKPGPGAAVGDDVF